MSVIVKGMEMPKDCTECKFLCSEDFEMWCHVTDRSDVYIDALPDWCPLAELPEKHGRLIDADALLTKTINNLLRAPYIVERDIQDMPTIVEAEGEDA